MVTNNDARDPSARGVVRLVETGNRCPVVSVSAIVQFKARVLLHAERPTNLSCLCRNPGTPSAPRTIQSLARTASLNRSSFMARFTNWQVDRW
jgi:hypothetical protein